jgi:uncharacterized protein (TIGR00251 family)
MVRLESHAEGTILLVRAKPGARRQGVLGEHDGALRVAVTAAADKGKANQAIAKLLSTTFGIPQSSIELIGGATSRQKRFLLRGMSVEQATAIVFRLLNPEP